MLLQTNQIFTSSCQRNDVSEFEITILDPMINLKGWS